MSHLTVGIISVALGLWGMASWWSVFGLVMRGVIPFTLLLFGVIAILAACRRMGLAVPAAASGQPSEPAYADDMRGGNDIGGPDDILGS